MIGRTNVIGGQLRGMAEGGRIRPSMRVSGQLPGGPPALCRSRCTHNAHSPLTPPTKAPSVSRTPHKEEQGHLFRQFASRPLPSRLFPHHFHPPFLCRLEATPSPTCHRTTPCRASVSLSRHDFSLLVAYRCAMARMPTTQMPPLPPSGPLLERNIRLNALFY